MRFQFYWTAVLALTCVSAVELQNQVYDYDCLPEDLDLAQTELDSHQEGGKDLVFPMMKAGCGCPVDRYDTIGNPQKAKLVLKEDGSKP